MTMSLTEATAWAQEHARMSVQESVEWAEGYVVRRGGSPAQPAVAESAAAAPSGITLAAEQFTQLLDRVAARAAATPVRESAEPVTAAPSTHGLPDGWPDKPLHQYTEHERAQFVDRHMTGAVYHRSGRPPLGSADLVAGINAQHVTRA